MSAFPSPAVRVVTDSTACLDGTGVDVDIVPLHVVVDGESFLEGRDISSAELADAIISGRDVSTSQPTPEQFRRTYARLVAQGAREIVSVHLSGQLSGTAHAAAAAAHDAAARVHVVDSRTIAAGLGFAVRAAASAAAQGATGADVARAAITQAASSREVFLVDSLEHLRRGGRLSRAAAAAGTVLGLRPLLTLRDGRIEVMQKVRTRAAAVARVIEMVSARATTLDDPVVEVHYLDDNGSAAAVAQQIVDRTGAHVGCSPVGAVIGAHAGPGLLAVVVAERPPGDGDPPGDLRGWDARLRDAAEMRGWDARLRDAAEVKCGAVLKCSAERAALRRGDDHSGGIRMHVHTPARDAFIAVLALGTLLG